jgi:hypothetical protein
VSPQSAKTMVLVCGALMFAAVALRRQTIQDPFRFAWAAGVITLGLSVLADIAPEIAGPFALLVLMAVYWKNRAVLGSLNPAKTTAAPASGTSTALSSAVSPGLPASSWASSSSLAPGLQGPTG